MFQMFAVYNSNLSNGVKDAIVEDFKFADKVMVGLMAVNWLLVSTLSAYSYGTYKLGIIGGGVAFLLAFIAYKLFGGTSISRSIMGIAIMLFPIIMIQQQLGLIEMHFHVFVVLAFLTLYKDIVPLLVSCWSNCCSSSPIYIFTIKWSINFWNSNYYI